MHNILENKQTINIQAIVGHLEATKEEREVLVKELNKITKDPSIEYAIPCSSDKRGICNERIMVEAKPEAITTRLTEEIEKREQYIWDLLLYVENMFTEGFDEQ